MATGENLFSMQDARNLIRYGGMRADRDWLQFDCALSYGLVEYLRTLDMLQQHGWSRSRCIPHGGHQMSLNIAAGLGLGGNESYPDLFQPFGGFPDGVKVENGYITMPDLVGIGFEGKSDLYSVMRSCQRVVGLGVALPEARPVAERVRHFQDAAPVLVADAGPRKRVILRLRFAVTGRRCRRRGAAVPRPGVASP
jgi:hypothetical protein